MQPQRVIMTGYSEIRVSSTHANEDQNTHPALQFMFLPTQKASIFYLVVACKDTWRTNKGNFTLTLWKDFATGVKSEDRGGGAFLQ